MQPFRPHKGAAHGTATQTDLPLRQVPQNQAALEPTEDQQEGAIPKQTLLYLLQNFLWEHPVEPCLHYKLLSKFHPIQMSNFPDQVNTVPVILAEVTEHLHVFQVTFLLLHLALFWRRKSKKFILPWKKRNTSYLADYLECSFRPTLAYNPFLTLIMLFPKCSKITRKSALRFPWDTGSKHFQNQDLNTWRSFPVTPTKTSPGQAQECSCILLLSSSTKELVLILRALPLFLVFPSTQLPRWWSALRTASCIHSTGLTSSVQELDSEIPLKSLLWCFTDCISFS